MAPKDKLNVKKRGSRILNRLSSRKDSKGSRKSMEEDEPSVDSRLSLDQTHTEEGTVSNAASSLESIDKKATAGSSMYATPKDASSNSLTSSGQPSAPVSPQPSSAAHVPLAPKSVIPKHIDLSAEAMTISESPEITPRNGIPTSSDVNTNQQQKTVLQVEPESPTADLSRKLHAELDKHTAQSGSERPSAISLAQVPTFEQTMSMPYSPLASPNLQSSGHHYHHNYSHRPHSRAGSRPHSRPHSAHPSRHGSVTEFKHSYNAHFSTTCLPNYTQPELDNVTYSRTDSAIKLRGFLGGSRSGSSKGLTQLEAEASGLLYRTGSQMWEAARESKGQSWLSNRSAPQYDDDEDYDNNDNATGRRYCNSSDSEDDDGILHIGPNRRRRHSYSSREEREDLEYELRLGTSKFIRAADWILGLQEDAPNALSEAWNNNRRPLSREEKIRLRDSHQAGKVDVAWWMALYNSVMTW